MNPEPTAGISPTDGDSHLQVLNQYRLRLQSILNGTTEALFLVDAHYGLLLFNDKALEFAKKFFRYELRQGHHFLEMFPDGRRKVVKIAIDRALRGEPTEYEIFYPPDLWALVNYKIAPDTTSGRKEICISARDISKRKIAEEEIKMLSLLARETANGVMVTDRDSRITWVNESFTRIYGYSRRELIGKHPKSIFAGPATSPKTLQQIDEHVRRGRRFSCELASYHKDGKQLWLRLDMQPVFSPGRKQVKYFVMLTDLTEQLLQRQNEIRNRLDQQKQTNRIILKAQEDLMNELGRELHDNINQILTAAKLQVEFGLSGEQVNLAVAESGVAHIEKAINEIRTLSKQLTTPSAGEGDLLQDIQSLVENLRLQKVVELDTSQFNGLRLSAELKLQVFRILQEAFKNIIKHAQATAVKLRLQNPATGFRMIIEDNGIGFNTKDSGEGIGLTNIRHRVESFGGSMAIHSSPGAGCRLTVTFGTVGALTQRPVFSH